jgi:acetolactate synthase-1/2/3 large subunit
MHGKGFLPESHPNWAGVLGRARRTTVLDFIRRADLVLAVGYDPIEINYEEWLGPLPAIHINSEPADADSTVNVTNALGPLDSTLARLAQLPPIANDWSPDDFSTHRRTLAAALRPAGARLATHHVLDRLKAALPSDAILAYDVGAHTHQIATQWQTDLPNTCFSTNGWSSMGFGIPAAYAAKLAYPNRTVVGVVGDGCFQMTAGELAVGQRLGLAVPIIVLDDGWLGLIKVKQERKGYQHAGVKLGDLLEPPAHYFGVPVRSAKSTAELDRALEWALGLRGPSVIQVQVDVEPYSTTVYD